MERVVTSHAKEWAVRGKPISLLYLGVTRKYLDLAEHYKHTKPDSQMEQKNTATQDQGKKSTHLSQGEDTLARSCNTPSDHDVVLTHITIVGEATHWGDGLLSWVKLGGSVVLHQLQHTSRQCTLPL